MITPRMECIISHITKKRVADIGTDHAYIPISLIQQGICDSVIATDIRSGPAEIAKKNIVKYELSDKIEVRLGNGLLPINSGECEQCIIAGMGGIMIKKILAGKMLMCEYILQPMNYQYDLRKYLYENGFEITNEDLAAEGFKIYNIICVKKGKMTKPDSELDYHIPPSLYTHKNIGMLKSKKHREFMKIKRGLEKSAEPDRILIEKYESLISRLEKI